MKEGDNMPGISQFSKEDIAEHFAKAVDAEAGEVKRLRGKLADIAEQLKKWAIESGAQCARCEEDESVEYYAGRKDAFSDAYQLIPEDVLTGL